MRRFAILLALAAPVAAHAEQPADFLFSAPIATESPASHYRVTLPAQSYRGAVRRDLGDLRIFNAVGEPVPYAFVQRDVPRAAPTMQPVKLFPLYGDEAKGLDATSMRVERNARGTVVSVSVNERAGPKGRRVLGYLLDPGEIKATREALLLDWDTPEGFTAQARVEASDDLKSWYPVTTNAPILSLQHAGASLERSRVEIPGARGRYLRLSLTGVPQRFVLKEIRVELRPEVAPPAREWLALNGTAGKSSGEWLFDTAGHFPVDRVRLRLPQPNTVTQVQLLTRERLEDTWRPAASGIAYRLSAAGGADVVNPDIAVGTKSDRYWLVRVEQRGGGVGAGELGLDIGWLPQEVVFVARGAAPFTVGFGSEKHASGALPLGAVLPRRPDGDPVAVGVATIGAVSGVAEEPALLREPVRYVQRLAARRDVKKWALWTALVAGVLLLGWMAFRLLHDVGKQP